MSRLKVFLAIAACLTIVAVVGLAAWPNNGSPGVASEDPPAVAGAEPAEGEAAVDAEEFEGEPGDEEEEEEGNGPEDLYVFQRTIGGTAMPGGPVQAKAGAKAARIRKRTRRVAPAVAHKRWSFLGPTNIGARVTDLVADASRADTVWAATATGGVWVSKDAGDTFEYAWNDRFTQSIGAIAQAPDGTLYVGTGEANPGGGSLTFGGDGLYRSRDRGRTWERVGLTESSTIGRLVVHPGDPDHVVAAVSGDVFAAGGQRGLYESRDGGDTWARILKPPNGTTGAVDVAIDPKDPDNILVAMWITSAIRTSATTPARARASGGPPTAARRSPAWASRTDSRLPPTASAGSASRSTPGIRAAHTRSTPTTNSALSRPSSRHATAGSTGSPRPGLRRSPRRRASMAGGSPACGSIRPTRTTSSSPA